MIGKVEFFAATKVIFDITIRSPARMIVTKDRKANERFVEVGYPNSR